MLPRFVHALHGWGTVEEAARRLDELGHSEPEHRARRAGRAR